MIQVLCSRKGRCVWERMKKGLNESFSVAIFNYLSDQYKKNEWYPTDLKERARVDEYNHWQHLNLRANGSMVFQTKVPKSIIAISLH